MIESPAPHDIALAIQARFPIEPVRSVPEIRLHRAGPRSGLSRMAEADAGFGNPYWAHLWGGGLALARHVLDQPACVAGKRVLDLGTGSGLVAIAAAMAGAREVVAAEVDRYAVVAAELNAAINGVRIETLLEDLTAGPAPDVDVVLVGDLFYDDELARRVTGFLDRCVARGVEVLVGDPGRRFLPMARLTLIAEYPGGDFGGAADDVALNAVFAFGGA